MQHHIISLEKIIIIKNIKKKLKKTNLLFVKKN